MMKKISTLTKFLWMKYRKKPVSLFLEVTHLCNARCDFCNFWKTTSADQLDDFYPIVRKFNPVMLNLTGGEPLLRDDLSEQIRKIKNNINSIYISLCTNGSLLTCQKAIELNKCGVDFFSISLDFIGERHDKERGIPGLFNHIFEIVPRLTSKGLKIFIDIVIMQDNIDHLLDLAEQVYRWGAKTSYSTYAMIKTNNKRHFISKEDLPKLRKVIYEIKKLKRKLGHIITTDYYLDNIANYFENYEQGGIPNCLAGRHWIHITPQGYIKPCADLPVIAHYSDFNDFKGTNCTACWYNCRGEAQAPLTFSRIKNVMKIL